MPEDIDPFMVSLANRAAQRRNAPTSPTISPMTHGERLTHEIQNTVDTFKDQPLLRLSKLLGINIGNAPAPYEVLESIAAGGGEGLKNLRQRLPAFIQIMKSKAETLPEWVPDFIQYMTEKYPRVLAHINDINPQNPSSRLNDLMEGKVTFGSRSPTRNPQLSNFEFNKERADPETAFHETAHAIQGIRDPQFVGDYRTNNQVMGYHNNPHEVNARLFGRKQAEKFDDWRNQNNPATVKIGENFLDPKGSWNEPQTTGFTPVTIGPNGLTLFTGYSPYVEHGASVDMMTEYLANKHNPFLVQRLKEGFWK